MTDPDQPLLDIADLPTDIDHLMSLNPLQLTPAARDAHLDAVIAYHRNIRAAKEAGMKVPRGKARAKAEGSAAKPKLSLADLGLGSPTKPSITRRV